MSGGRGNCGNHIVIILIRFQIKEMGENVNFVSLEGRSIIQFISYTYATSLEYRCSKALKEKVFKSTKQIFIFINNHFEHRLTFLHCGSKNICLQGFRKKDIAVSLKIVCFWFSLVEWRRFGLLENVKQCRKIFLKTGLKELVFLLLKDLRSFLLMSKILEFYRRLEPHAVIML